MMITISVIDEALPVNRHKQPYLRFIETIVREWQDQSTTLTSTVFLSIPERFRLTPRRHVENKIPNHGWYAGDL